MSDPTTDQFVRVCRVDELPDDEAALGEWLADESVPKAAHDVKAALHGLRARGWTVDYVRLDDPENSGSFTGWLPAAMMFISCPPAGPVRIR